MTPRPTSPSANMDDFDQDDDFAESSAGSDRSMKTKRLILDLLGRWYWIVLGLILGTLGAAYYLSKAPKQYSATSTLLIKQQTSTVMSRDRVDDIDMRSIEGLNTVAERIRRPELLERVAARVDVRALPGLIPSEVDWTPEWLASWMSHSKNAANPGAKAAATAPPPPPALAGWIGSWMTISVRRGTRLLDISFKHQVPEVAKALADAVAREYLAEIAGTLTQGRDSQSDTLLKQSEEARKKLQAAESALATYSRALEVHTALDAQEAVCSQLARRYKPKHPKMIAATSELIGLKSRFMDEFNGAVTAPADEAYWKTAMARIRASEGDPEAQLRVARQLLLARIGVLKGETNSQMTFYNAMLTRLQESNVNREGEESSVEISSFARVPGMPTAPQPPKVYAAGAAGGLAAGLCLAFLLVRIDNKYHSVAQIEAEVGLPVLGAISEIDPRHLAQAIRAATKNGPLAPVSKLQEAWDQHLLFRPGTSATNFAEMFRILRASVSLLGDENKRKVTLFSSALPGEGKSLMSSNFALAAAGQGRKTLLIDLDLRKPSIHRVFGKVRSEQGPGITEWLAGQASFEDIILHDTGAENLHIIFSGTRAPNPGELLDATRLKRLFTEACEQYDQVVIDSAPLLAVPDTRIIAPLVDNFCLVVRANYVPKGAVLRTMDLLGSSDGKPSGLVFNGFKETRRMIGQNYSYGSYRMSRFGSPYQYGYGSYGAYGENETDEAKEIAARVKKSKKFRS